MAIRQHMIRADRVKQLIQLLTSTQSVVILHVVVEVVRLDVREAHTLHDTVEVAATIFRRVLKPRHAYLKQSLLIGNANLQIDSYKPHYCHHRCETENHATYSCVQFI